MSEQDAVTRPFRVIIADDHEFTRAGLRILLEGEPDILLSGEATNGREALALCRDLQPDLALLDIHMPEMDGLAVTWAIKEVSPQTRVMIVTMHERPDYLLEALRAGVAGYVLNESSRKAFLIAVRQVLRGDTFVNGSITITIELLQHLAHTPGAVGQLTARERDVLQLVALGKTNREIGRILSISLGTVKIHVEHIISKLGVSDRTQAAVRALELGLLGPAHPNPA
ncbi:MAG: response regulator transcription factor [Chloroflexales bacterium]